MCLYPPSTCTRAHVPTFIVQNTPPHTSIYTHLTSPWEIFGGQGEAPLSASPLDNKSVPVIKGSPIDGWRLRILAAPGMRDLPWEEELKTFHAEALMSITQPGLSNKVILESPPPRKVTIDWVNDPIWFIDSPSFENHNPFHWLEKLGPLWEAQRSNGSHSLFDDWNESSEGAPRKKRGGALIWGDHPRDAHILWHPYYSSALSGAGLAHPSLCARKAPNGGKGPDFPLHCPVDAPRSSFRTEGFGSLPAQSIFLFSSHKNQYEPSDNFLDFKWAAETLELAAQAGHRVISPTDAKRGYNASHLLCSRRGVVSTIKPRIFSGRADAYTFRNGA